MNHFFFNGVDAATGRYSHSPLEAALVAKLARSERISPAEAKELSWWYENIVVTNHFGPMDGVDPEDLGQAGWGVVFAHDCDPAIREALAELIEWRRQQASTVDERFFRISSGKDGHRPGESKLEFLKRHNVGPGPADPHRMPYYLLVVGEPERIPFRFQYQLDVQYAVGRLDFDTPDEYARYARAVVQRERAAADCPGGVRRAVFFGPCNKDDPATQSSVSEMLQPLSESFSETRNDLEVEEVTGDAATKSRLSHLFNGEVPSLLFTASHGLVLSGSDSRQRDFQGAVVCQEWEGPNSGSLTPEMVFAADDVALAGRLNGLILFCFNCFGGGTPRYDDFALRDSATRSQIAPHSFVARLPQRLLGHSENGAAAVIAHVDRAWANSFIWGKAGRQLQTLESVLRRLLNGCRIGWAMEFLNQRYAELATDLNGVLEDVKYGGDPDEMMLSTLWTSHQDAKNYAVFGDPAVRVPMLAPVERASRTAGSPRRT